MGGNHHVEVATTWGSKPSVGDLVVRILSPWLISHVRGRIVGSLLCRDFVATCDSRIGIMEMDEYCRNNPDRE